MANLYLNSNVFQLPEAVVVADNLTAAALYANDGVLAGGEEATKQYAAPISDYSSSGWSPSVGGSIFGCIDEEPYSDADYISCVGPATWIGKLASLLDPYSSSGYGITVRAKGDGSHDIIASLLQGLSTTIASYTIPAESLTTSFQDFPLPLSGAEADSVTDHTNLYLKLQTVVT